MNEDFKVIKGFYNIYSASNLGNIRNNYTGRILRQRVDKNGYYLVNLRKDNKQHTMIVHRLVIMTFSKLQYNKNEVNHIDGNKLNNHLYNLEWCDRLENMKHASILGLLTGHSGKCIIDSETGIEYKSISECSRHLNKQRCTIRNNIGKQFKLITQ